VRGQSSVLESSTGSEGVGIGARITSELDLTTGDPLDRVARRVRFKVGDPTNPVRPIVLILAIAVLPLFIITALEGTLGSLLRDPLILGRLLISFPLLELSGAPISRAMARALRRFEREELVPAEEQPQFDATVAASTRMRDSVLALILIIVIAFGIALVGGRDATLSYVLDWAHREGRLSLAGWWYVLVSLAVFQLIRLRWLWRLLVWWRFLFGVSRIHLRLMPSHPDKAGGLGFLSSTVDSFGLLMFALCVGFGFDFRALILRGGESLDSLTIAMIGVPLLLMLWIVAPLVFFVPQLNVAKKRGRADFAVLAARYTRRFDARWLGADADDTQLLGTSDLQSLADLGNSYGVVQNMRLIPLSKKTAVALMLIATAAMLPAITAEIPIKEILLKVLSRVY
jgi:hypothetical protein